MSVKNGSRERKIKETVFLYQDQHGNDAFEVVRIPPKQFRVRYKDESGKYVWKAPAKNYPYRLPEVLGALRGEVIYITEGEKDAETLRGLGLVATTMRGGTGNTRLWEPWGNLFAGRIVCILPDNDGPGMTHATKVARYLLPHANVVLTLNLPGLPTKGDVTDWMALKGNTRERFLDLVVAELENSAWGQAQRAPAEPVAQPAGDAYEPPQPDAGDDEDLADGFEPFPLDALPPILAKYAQAGADALPCDPAMLVLPMLVSCAGAIGNSRLCQIKGTWKEPSILWAIGIAEPASRKSAAYRLVHHAIEAVDLEWARESADELAAYEDAVSVWEAQQRQRIKLHDEDAAGRRPKKPDARKLLVGDITVETAVRDLRRNPRGLVLLRDELSGWMQSFGRYSASGAGSAEVACWTECFEGGAYRYDRSTGEGTSVVIPRCSISVYGTIQPEVMQRCFSQSFFDSGFAYRFVLAAPPRRRGKMTDLVIPHEVAADYAALVAALAELDRVEVLQAGWQPRLIPLDADAWARWSKYHDDIEDQVEASQGDRRRLLSKGKALCARLALVLQTIDQVVDPRTPAVITARHVDAAARVALWFLRETERVYCIIRSAPDKLEMARLTEWLKDRGTPITARELYHSNKSVYGSSAGAKLALDRLAAGGAGCWRQRVTTLRGGRPTAEFSLCLSRSETSKPLNHVTSRAPE